MASQPNDSAKDNNTSATMAAESKMLEPGPTHLETSTTDTETANGKTRHSAFIASQPSDSANNNNTSVSVAAESKMLESDRTHLANPITKASNGKNIMDLPPELLELVSEQLQDLNDVRRLRLVNKTFSEVALHDLQKHLQTVFLEPRKESIERFKEICGCERIAKSIKVVIYFGGLLVTPKETENDNQHRVQTGRITQDMADEVLGGYTTAYREQQEVVKSGAVREALLLAVDSFPKLDTMEYLCAIDEDRKGYNRGRYWRSESVAGAEDLKPCDENGQEEEEEEGEDDNPEDESDDSEKEDNDSEEGDDQRRAEEDQDSQSEDDELDEAQVEEKPWAPPPLTLHELWRHVLFTYTYDSPSAIMEAIAKHAGRDPSRSLKLRFESCKVDALSDSWDEFLLFRPHILQTAMFHINLLYIQMRPSVNYGREDFDPWEENDFLTEKAQTAWKPIFAAATNLQSLIMGWKEGERDHNLILSTIMENCTFPKLSLLGIVTHGVRLLGRDSASEARRHLAYKTSALDSFLYRHRETLERLWLDQALGCELDSPSTWPIRVRALLERLRTSFPKLKICEVKELLRALGPFVDSDEASWEGWEDRLREQVAASDLAEIAQERGVEADESWREDMVYYDYAIDFEYDFGHWVLKKEAGI